MEHRVTQELLLAFAFLGEMICYGWMLVPSKSEDELVLKIIMVGFVATPVFMILCGKVFLIQRKSREGSKKVRRDLFIINGLLAMYPIFMGLLIYILAWIQG